ncbi:MAG: hypothetical protein AUJ97_08085 [Bacteroidetes bacterium CG2_30_32_10]|nr:MAG: hypothetical protein AUJ97_08085 [Bacteroidetes bacterium CG2_30_32_10]
MKETTKIRKILLLSVLFLLAIINPNILNSQTTERPISATVPFLLIAPDARSGAMGDAGVSSSPDVYSQHWNPAKYPFTDKDMGFSISYNPWLRKLVNDISLTYLTGYKKFNENQVVSASILYFTLGNITFTTDQGTPIGDFKPNEFSIDLAYSRLLSDDLSAGIAGRFINSNLTQGQDVNKQATKPGQSVAADVSVYYHKKIKISKQKDATIAAGLNISNIGSKMSYTESKTFRDFIPTNLRLGPSIAFDIDQYNSLSFMIDLNKMLVPTPNDSGVPDVGLVSGMFQSFGDAPGGFKEELHEIMYSFGAEYWYNKQFALRGGYLYENKYKGNRKYFTLGAGLKYNIFGLDFAYLIPVETHNPLENTLRFSLLIDFEGVNKQVKK